MMNVYIHMLLPCLTELFSMEPQDALFRGGVDPDGLKPPYPTVKVELGWKNPPQEALLLPKKNMGVSFLWDPRQNKHVVFLLVFQAPKQAPSKTDSCLRIPEMSTTWQTDLEIWPWGTSEHFLPATIVFGHRSGDSRSSKRWPPGPDAGFGSGGAGGAGANEVGGGEKRRRFLEEAVTRGAWTAPNCWQNNPGPKKRLMQKIRGGGSRLIKQGLAASKLCKQWVFEHSKASTVILAKVPPVPKGHLVGSFGL